jgi:hypothetical protein
MKGSFLKIGSHFQSHQLIRDQGKGYLSKISPLNAQIKTNVAYYGTKLSERYFREKAQT